MAININQIVAVNSSVINATVTAPALIGNILTENILLPADNNRSLLFSSTAAVGAYFGLGSDEYMYAKTYFTNVLNFLTAPGAILFSRYVQTPTAAYLFSSQIANPASIVNSIVALTTPVMTCNINGLTQTLVLAQADFAACTGLTQIATVIQTALDLQLAGCTCTVIGINQFSITAPTTSSATTTIGYCTGNVAVLMGIDSTSAPTLSQGTSGGNASFNMSIIANYNPNWIALSYTARLANDTAENGYPVTLDLSSWIAANQATTTYIGMWWEGGTDALNPASITNMSSALVASGYGTRTPNNQTGQVVFNTRFAIQYNGIGTNNTVTSDEVGIYAAFTAGCGASINYTTGTTINFAAKQQAGLTPTVSNTQDYQNLLLQGYGVYGQFASSTTTYNLTENGSVGGGYAWLDEAYNAGWLIPTIQNSIATLNANVPRIPYNKQGIQQIKAVVTDIILNQALKNGVIETGNPFTPIQIQQIITLVGADVSSYLTNNGYYLFFPTIQPQMRITRAPLPMYLLYTNGGAINTFTANLVFVA